MSWTSAIYLDGLAVAITANVHARAVGLDPGLDTPCNSQDGAAQTASNRKANRDGDQ
jgi:hypothetical protein